MIRMTAAILGLASLLSPALAEPVEVDVELALMVDVSRSMRPAELEIQRRGYAEAIASDQVVGAILNGFTGQIALTYVEWAGDSAHRVIVPWTLIDSQSAAKNFATQLTARFPVGMRRTSISGAIDFAIGDIAENEFRGLRQVIDISGDGPNNQGRAVTEARDAAVAAGLVVNGLPLMTRDGMDSVWGVEDLDLYYEACVVGGPGAFVIPVTDWGDFPLAVRRKIVLELVGPPEALVPVRSGRTETGYDCLIGEKLRRERELLYDEF